VTIRKANQERLAFWSEFCQDAVGAFLEKGFTQDQAMRLTCALLAGKEVVWSAPPGVFAEPDAAFH
jgi:hypothetical protein